MESLVRMIHTMHYHFKLASGHVMSGKFSHNDTHDTLLILLSGMWVLALGIITFVEHSVHFISDTPG